ncbi:hypothetical protein QNN00_08690 [Bacillus velezensis]|nr:hypothetical protein [Bacillus velezensis]
MEKINITHFYFMEEGKRIEETVEAIDLGNGQQVHNDRHLLDI